jgi:hypothetical protein
MTKVWNTIGNAKSVNDREKKSTFGSQDIYEYIGDSAKLRVFAMWKVSSDEFRGLFR